MTVMNGGKAVVEIIRAYGSTQAFCVPGESFLAVIDAYYDYDDIQLTATRHEEGAVFMAEGWAKATGKVGVAMATRGVGGGNLSIGVHTAYQDSTPMVVIVGQVPFGWKYREAFQEVDHDRFFGTIAKMAITIDQTERIPELMNKAFRTAISGRPGPVVVAIPEDVLAGTADMTFPTIVAVPPKARPDAAAVTEAVDRLLAADYPLILAGGGVLRAGGTQELQALAEAVGAQVYAAWRRFDVMDNNHPLFGGSIALGTRKDVLEPLGKADVVLAVGTRFQEVTTQEYRWPKAGVQVIHIDISPDVVGSVVDPVLGMVADARLALTDLLAEVQSRGYTGTEPHQARLDRAGIHREMLTRISTPRSFADSTPVDPEGVIYAMREALPTDTAIVNDAGSFSGWAARYYPYQQPGTFFGPTSGAMGYALPASIGIKLATPHRPVICLAGDGGFMMVMSELATAVQLNVPIIALVFNNGMYGSIRNYQERLYPGRPIATALQNPSFAGVAREFGCHAERVECNADLPAALERALHAGRPAVIELIMRPERRAAGLS